MPQKVLVTGLSGLIGSALRSSLESDPNVGLSALNRRAVPGVPTTQADLSDYDAIAGAFENQELVIHLAAKIHDGVGWQALLDTNGRMNQLHDAMGIFIKNFQDIKLKTTPLVV